MKKGIILFVLATAMFSCKEEEKKGKGIVFESVVIESEKECDGIKCPLIDIQYPQITTTSFPVEAINNHIEQAVAAIIIRSEKDEVTTKSVEEAINDFKEEFKEADDLTGGIGGFEAKVKGMIAYQSPKLISLKLDSFMFAGGAHGFTSTRYININAEKGTVLSDKDLFKDAADFKVLAEKAFRKHEKISDSMSLEDAGYWFDEDVFQLPDNIGFTKTDIILFYNPYDVSPYSEGPIEVKIPLEKVKGNLLVL